METLKFFAAIAFATFAYLVVFRVARDKFGITCWEICAIINLGLVGIGGIRLRRPPTSALPWEFLIIGIVGFYACLILQKLDETKSCLVIHGQAEQKGEHDGG